MMTIEIKVNDKIVEVITVKNVETDHDPLDTEAYSDYLVNNTFIIQHRRRDGHRDLAREALKAIKHSKA